MENETISKLRLWASTYNVSEFTGSDPVQFPKMYLGKSAEISGFVTAWLSFGNRKAIVAKASFVNGCLLGKDPWSFIAQRLYSSFEYMHQVKIYRMLSYHDFYLLCDRLHLLYTEFESMEEMIIQSGKSPLQAISEYFQGIKGIADYSKGSACKRLCMFLRWMIRKDGIVDLGIWQKLSQKDLIIPLDTHVHQIALELGITSRKQADLRTATEITDYFRAIFPDDPSLGDFALFGYGINKHSQNQ